ASDCSDDGSDDIVRSFAGRGVRLVASPERRGKEHAQGLAIQQAHGDSRTEKLVHALKKRQYLACPETEDLKAQLHGAVLVADLEQHQVISLLADQGRQKVCRPCRKTVIKC
ncbi:MAG: hypothetical protein WCR21_12035, partial [Bacteroidota bacterium]